MHTYQTTESESIRPRPLNRFNCTFKPQAYGRPREGDIHSGGTGGHTGGAVSGTSELKGLASQVRRLLSVWLIGVLEVLAGLFICVLA